MGYRATVITKHREYGSQTFSNWDMFMYSFMPGASEAGLDISENDAQDFFEVEKKELQKFVDNLPKDEEVSIYPDYTNKELAEELQTAIDEVKDEWISWEWY